MLGYVLWGSPTPLQQSISLQPATGIKNTSASVSSIAASLSLAALAELVSVKFLSNGVYKPHEIGVLAGHRWDGRCLIAII